MMQKEVDIDIILELIEKLRNIYGIKDYRTYNLPEISCIAYPGGEIAQLVERQLMHLEYPYGSWESVETDPELRVQVYEYLIKEIDAMMFRLQNGAIECEIHIDNKTKK